MEGGEGTAHRGSGGLIAAVDFALELYKNGNGENRRNLRALSRRRETPAELIIELTPLGYICLGTPAAVSRNEVKRQIQSVLPNQPEQAKTYEQIRELLDPQPGLTMVKEVIDELVKESVVEREARGVKGDPLRFWKPDSFSVTPSVTKATETEMPAREPGDAPGLKDGDGSV